MKTIILYSSVVLASFAFSESKAQVHVDVNIGRPVYVNPAPVAVSYYYLPDAEAYYYVPTRVFYYQNRGHWVSSRHLPGYHNYNIYNVRHIAINEHRPYHRHDYYRSKYNVRHSSYVYRDRPEHRHSGKFKKSRTHRGRGHH
ncbi:hypothetical protein [Arcticibacter tournemirensis]